MESLLGWVRENPVLAQTLSALVLAGLTAILLLVTGFYAWATWKHLGVAEKSLRQAERIDVEPILGKAPGGGLSGHVCVLKVANLSGFGILIRSLELRVEWRKEKPKLGEPRIEEMEATPWKVDEVVSPYSISSSIPLDHRIRQALSATGQQAWRLVVEGTVWFKANGKVHHASTGFYEVDLGQLGTSRVDLIAPATKAWTGVP